MSRHPDTSPRIDASGYQILEGVLKVPLDLGEAASRASSNSRLSSVVMIQVSV